MYDVGTEHCDFYISCELHISSRKGGWQCPKFRIDTSDIGEATEEQAVNKATAMIRAAFESARKQKQIEDMP